MIHAFPDIVKAASDIVSVPLDWTPFLPPLSNTLTVATHSVSTKCGDVTAIDEGMTGTVQTVKVSGGTCESYTDVIARVTLSDGTDVSRAFRVRVQ